MTDELVEDFLEHHGILGMKWGVRKDRTPGVSSRTDRTAEKDAKEFARAKMFYGEGAGTRRKLIKAQVESRSKADPDYKKAFDRHLSNQDLGRHGEKARSERHRKDVVKSTAKTARGIKNLAIGAAVPVTMASLLIYKASTNPQVQSFVRKNSKKAFSAATNSTAMAAAKAFLRKKGLG